MKSARIPEEQQLEAMMTGTVYELASRYVDNPSRYDLRRYLSVKRQQVIDYLVRNPDKAKAYFERERDHPASHDVEKMWHDGSQYCVAYMDRGNTRDIRCFKTLAEAVAEHVLISYGMY